MSETERELRNMLRNYGAIFRVGSKLFTTIEEWEDFLVNSTEEQKRVALDAVNAEMQDCHAKCDCGL